MLVAIGNIPSYGGGMKVTPNAIVDDGNRAAVGRGGPGAAQFHPAVGGASRQPAAADAAHR